MSRLTTFVKNGTLLGVVAIIAGISGIGIAMLLTTVTKHKVQAREQAFPIVSLDDNIVDPAIWGRNFPRQYDGYLKTSEIGHTPYGTSEAYQKLDADPRLREIFNGYAFSIDYRQKRGHAYMLQDQDSTQRVKVVKQPASCLQCHASIINVYRDAGIAAGVPADPSHRQEQIQKGFEKICPMPLTEVRPLVKHPVACIDCHEPKSMRLRVSRPGFINGIRGLANSTAALPQFHSIEQWRTQGKKVPYDPNTMASRQEMRSFVCGQCHVEYYFKPEDKTVIYPWDKGLKVEQIEAYYDTLGYKDWLHKATAAPVLKAQHPEFELWNQGIHARSGVSCADCHMPYKREGAIKISEHHVRSPLLSVGASCQICHHYDTDEIKARVATIQDRNKALLDRSEDALVALIRELDSAKDSLPPEALKKIHSFQRKAQWRIDFVAAENSMGFHAPQECARILAEGIDYARQGQVILSQTKRITPVATSATAPGK